MRAHTAWAKLEFQASNSMNAINLNEKTKKKTRRKKLHVQFNPK